MNPNTNSEGDAIYTVSDIAGNTLKLDIRTQNKGNNLSFNIYSLQYNSDPPKVLDPNQFKVLYSGIKKRMNISEQSYEAKGIMKTRIQYNQKKNQSQIFITELTGERTETKSGLILLQLETNKGSLNTNY